MTDAPIDIEDDLDEAQEAPGKPPCQVDRLIEVVERHFPGPILSLESRGRTVEQACELYDESIRHCCALIAIISKKTVEFKTSHSAAKIIKNCIKYIDTKQYKLIPIEFNKQSRSFVQAMETELYGDQAPPIKWLSDVVRSVISPHAPSDGEFDGYWQDRRQKLVNLSAVIAKRRGSFNGPRDDAVREAVELWSLLSGERPRQPSHRAGGSDRQGRMFQFVHDVIEIYAEFGLRGAVPMNSGPAWSRILSDRNR